MAAFSELSPYAPPMSESPASSDNGVPVNAIHVGNGIVLIIARILQGFSSERLQIGNFSEAEVTR